MARKSSIHGGGRLRRTLQRIGDVDGPVIDGVKDVLEKGARDLKSAIEFNIVAAGLVDEGDLLNAIVLQRRSGGLAYRVGFTKKGAARAWKQAGFRAHFSEFGTERQPATPVVGPAAREVIPRLVAEVDNAVDAALRRFKK